MDIRVHVGPGLMIRYALQSRIMKPFLQIDVFPNATVIFKLVITPVNRQRAIGNNFSYKLLLIFIIKLLEPLTFLCTFYNILPGTG